MLQIEYVIIYDILYHSASFVFDDIQGSLFQKVNVWPTIVSALWFHLK